MKKAIVFDVDGVITDTGSQKDGIIESVVESYGVLEKPGIRELLGRGINRVIIANTISELYNIDANSILTDINRALIELETNPSVNRDIINFIESQEGEYLFFTNTSMPKRIMETNFVKFDIATYFDDLLAYEDGTKYENIRYIMEEYDISPEDIIFVDDKQTHIDRVAPLGVHTLLYTIGKTKIEEEVTKIFG